MRIYIVNGYDRLRDSIQTVAMFKARDGAVAWIEDNQEYTGQYYITEGDVV